jgi:hypothetical protein
MVTENKCKCSEDFFVKKLLLHRFEFMHKFDYNIACQHLQDAYTNTKIVLAYVPKTLIGVEVVGQYLSKLI